MISAVFEVSLPVFAQVRKRKARAAPPPKKVKSVAVVEKFVADKLPTLPSAQGYASRKHTSKARVLGIFGAITAFCAGDLDDTPA